MSFTQTVILHRQALAILDMPTGASSTRLQSIMKRSSESTEALIRRAGAFAKEKEALLKERALVQVIPELSSALSDEERAVLRQMNQTLQEENRRLKKELERTSHRGEDRLALQKQSLEQEIAVLKETVAAKEEEITSLKTKAKVDSDVALAEKRAIEEAAGFRLNALRAEMLEIQDREKAKFIEIMNRQILEARDTCRIQEYCSEQLWKAKKAFLEYAIVGNTVRHFHSNDLFKSCQELISVRLSRPALAVMDSDLQNSDTKLLEDLYSELRQTIFSLLPGSTPTSSVKMATIIAPLEEILHPLIEERKRIRR